MPSTYTNLLIRNEDYDPSYELPGDPVIGIQHQVSHKHFIKDDAEPSYTYTSYFYVRNKLPISIQDVIIYLASGETPDQPNVQTQFQQPDGSWQPSLSVSVGHIEPNATSAQQTFTIRIIRVLPGGSLNNFTLNTYFNPEYKVAYNANQDLWNSESQVIVEK